MRSWRSKTPLTWVQCRRIINVSLPNNQPISIVANPTELMLLFYVRYMNLTLNHEESPPQQHTLATTKEGCSLVSADSVHIDVIHTKSEENHQNKEKKEVESPEKANEETVNEESNDVSNQLLLDSVYAASVLSF
ncbi:unnamed protein product [Lactuca saligna]|uniref:Uncharacterized protein n=1 Tax=Lactuca saligna TaxID=75948 RepID=A0AA35ZLF4_LACSI|nr:unnamed protein product [Lactuca saligna]